MNKTELINKAKYRAILKINRTEYLRELQHYFNDDFIEIGFISFNGSEFENMQLFPNGREWDLSFFDNYELINLDTGKIVNNI